MSGRIERDPRQPPELFCTSDKILRKDLDLDLDLFLDPFLNLDLDPEDDRADDEDDDDDDDEEGEEEAPDRDGDLPHGRLRPNSSFANRVTFRTMSPG